MARLMRLCALTLLTATTVGADPLHPNRNWTAAPLAEPIRMTCKSVNSCREAVELWCGGYSRADADRDGVPCENVCGSREEVVAIEEEIGCEN